MIKMNRKEEKVILAAIIILGLVIVVSKLIVFKGSSNVQVIKDTANKEQTSAGGTKAEEPSRIYVYITGEVKNPAMYILKEGDRISDLVGMAGGFTDNADTVSINLAEKLKDEQHINIAPKNIVSSPGANVKSSINGGKININTATAKELDDFLPGIGEVYAKRIVDYRDKNGKFKAINEITRVDGIGAKRFESIKDMITVN